MQENVTERRIEWIKIEHLVESIIMQLYQASSEISFFRFFLKKKRERTLLLTITKDAVKVYIKDPTDIHSILITFIFSAKKVKHRTQNL